MKYSVVIPVYKNESSIPRLMQALIALDQQLEQQMEVIFVVDGSPDQSFALLRTALASVTFPAKLLAHSRNFGSFAAIRTGMIAAKGAYIAFIAADLQEPPELLLTFFAALTKNDCDVVIGTRSNRKDPLLSKMTAAIFWYFYRKLVVPDMPRGGVDVFGCNQHFRDELVKLEESRSSLIALIFWLGFRRKFVSYERKARQEGKSAWTFSKKIDYMMDSIFAFTDYPIRLLIKVGALGSLISFLLAVIVIVAKITGVIAVPGYAATMITVLMLGALNLFGLGLVGTYAWRGYENSKQRPLAIVAIQYQNQEKKESN